MELSLLFDKILRSAERDEEFRERILAAWHGERPLVRFCDVCRSVGIDIYPMDIADADESAYAAMRRSTNGGGENSPHLIWEEDIFESFVQQVEKLPKAKEL